MAETYITQDKTRTRQGNLVTPLDNVRQYTEQTCTVVSGISGTLLTGESGKVYYIRQMIACEQSGHDSKIQLKTVSNQDSGACNDGRLTPMMPVAEDACLCLNICTCALGPICPNSGTNNATIFTDSDTEFGGEVTLILTVDPQVVE